MTKFEESMEHDLYFQNTGTCHALDVLSLEDAMESCCPSCSSRHCCPYYNKGKMRPTDHDGACIICIYEMWGYCTHHDCEIIDVTHTTCDTFSDILEG